MSNAVVTPAIFARNRSLILSSSILIAEGPLQHREGVLHVRARRFRALAAPALPGSHDFR
jgi:hypothetical protein